MSTTPAFSPMPASSLLPFGVVSGTSPKRRRCTFEDLYEQCSDHMTEYMASSAPLGRRPRISLMRPYSSAVSPSSDHGWVWSGVRAAFWTESTTGLPYRPATPSDRRRSARPEPSRAGSERIRPRLCGQIRSDPPAESERRSCPQEPAPMRRELGNVSPLTGGLVRWRAGGRGEGSSSAPACSRSSAPAARRTTRRRPRPAAPPRRPPRPRTPRNARNASPTKRRRRATASSVRSSTECFGQAVSKSATPKMKATAAGPYLQELHRGRSGLPGLRALQPRVREHRLCPRQRVLARLT